MKITILSFLLFSFSIAFGQQKNVISKEFLEIQEKIKANYYQYEKYEETIMLVEQLDKISKNDLEKGIALFEKTYVILHCSADYNSGETALPYAFESTEILENAGDREWFHKACHLISIVYIKRYFSLEGDPNWEKAEKYNIIALRIQTDSLYKPKITYYDTFEDKLASKATLRESIKYTLENLALWEKRGSVPHMMWRNQALGKLSWNLNYNYSDAEKYLLKALEYANQINDNNHKFIILNELTVFALQSKLYKKALQYGKKNLDLALKMKNEPRESSVRDFLFKAYMALGQKDEAFDHKLKSVALVEKFSRETESTRNKIFKERNDILQKQIFLQNELKRQNTFKIFLGILVFSLLLGVAALLYYNFQLKKNNDNIKKAMLHGQTIERKRVAADLHDNLGSTLSALWLSLDTINQTKMNDEDKEIHQNLRENLEKAYNDVRLLSHNLLPEEFEKQGLIPTLQGFVRKMNKNLKIRFDLQIAEDFGRVNNKIEFELYSICLELVNNIIKHSKATEAKISLSRNEKQIELIVSDNGMGVFNNESDGRGMKNVKARVESLNGVWDLENIENKGFVNKIQVPI